MNAADVVKQVTRIERMALVSLARAVDPVASVNLFWARPDQYVRYPGPVWVAEVRLGEYANSCMGVHAAELHEALDLLEAAVVAATKQRLADWPPAMCDALDAAARDREAK